jgi:RNA polymerase sigma-70 factor (sigma-E family)
VNTGPQAVVLPLPRTAPAGTRRERSARLSPVSAPFTGRTRRAERAERAERAARAGLADAPADQLALLHREHFRPLVRLAAIVLGDVGLAEQVVQDAFVKLQLRWGGVRDLDKAPAYLRAAVLNGARSQLRRHKVRDRFSARRTVERPVTTPEAAALDIDDHDRMITALRRLSARQREALTLRYYLDLPEAEIAATMGVSAGSVKAHLHRGLANLGALLGPHDVSDDR